MKKNIKSDIETCKHQNYDKECCESEENEKKHCNCPKEDISKQQEISETSIEYDKEKNDRENN